MSLPPPALTGSATRVLGGPRCFARPRARSKLAARPRKLWGLKAAEEKKDSSTKIKTPEASYSSFYAGPMVPLMRCSPSRCHRAIGSSLSTYFLSVFLEYYYHLYSSSNLIFIIITMKEEKRERRGERKELTED